MAKYLIQIPANYRARVGGNSSVSVDASSPQEARTQVVQAGIPAALIGTPTEITGNITSGSLPPNVSEYALPSFGPDRNPLLRDDRVIGANNPTWPMGMENLGFGLPGGEQVSGNPFAANINRPPTMAEIQAAMPYQLGTPSSPFYQPPSYQQMTAEDFAQISANANQPLFDEQSFLGGSFNTGGRLPEEVAGISSGPTTGLGPSYDPTGGSFATDADEIASMEAAARKQLADRRAQELATATFATDTGVPEDIDAIDAIEAEIFARQERERLAKIRREAAAAGEGLDGDDGLDVPPVGPDPVTMPANLPPFWKEKYNEYLGLPGGQQQAILDNQLQNYIDLNDWQISTGGSTGEEGGGVSGAAGANLTLQELEALAAGGTTGGGGAGGGFGFQTGAFTGAGNIPQPMNLQGFPVTGLQDMLNIFYSDPAQYIVEQEITGTIGYDENGLPIEGIVGSQQSLSPVAEAALRAFSTQRQAESSDLASRFGTSTPFGAIAGLGGTSADALGLAELQARAGVSNPYGALGAGSGIGDIGTILRGGLSVEQQSALAGMQARGGLTPEQRLAEQRLGILPSLFQTTPQALGGLSRVLGGEEALRGALSPFFGGVAAQGAAPQQGVTANISGSPFGGQPVNMNIAGPAATQQPTPSFRPTLGDYQGAGMFEQGGFQAEAGIAGQELPKFLGEVSPQGTSTARGGLGATTTGRFTY